MKISKTSHCLYLHGATDTDQIITQIYKLRGSPGVIVVENPPANAGDIRDMGSIPGSGKTPGGGHGNPLQYSSLENPMDRGT